jgi:hypothetical protein
MVLFTLFGPALFSLLILLCLMDIPLEFSYVFLLRKGGIWILRIRLDRLASKWESNNHGGSISLGYHKLELLRSASPCHLVVAGRAVWWSHQRRLFPVSGMGLCVDRQCLFRLFGSGCLDWTEGIGFAVFGGDWNRTRGYLGVESVKRDCGGQVAELIPLGWTQAVWLSSISAMRPLYERKKKTPCKIKRWVAIG